ncbi:MAG TPA: DUF3999 family protein [Pyrinomonadaceae bacterium]|nr:DUF3999 family protein [Pyrinomonadaceae bacterium]
MKNFRFLVPSTMLLAMLSSVVAQTPISAWPFRAELNVSSDKTGMYDLVVPLQVMDKAREDLGDLRLFDSANREIPYALRIRRQVDNRTEVGGVIFNRATVGSLASEVSVDLGENPGEHNEIEIQTLGSDFRRRVSIEGSDSTRDWRSLTSDGVIFRFESRDHAVESNRVRYSPSRYRYLRVRVSADELSDSRVPEIAEIKTTRTVQQEGEFTSWNVPVPSYQLLRNQGAPASAWIIDLGGRVPCDRLALDIAELSFSRPFQLEAIDDLQNSRLLSSGELIRRTGEEIKPLMITFAAEQYVQRLRLLVTDHSNQTLSINSIRASAPARQLVFELKQEPTLPLQLFFGNLKIPQPHYDFEKELWARLSVQPTRIAVGEVVSNPVYKPEPLPLTERVPWLIYLVLTASTIALALILISLARKAMRTVPQPPDESRPAGSSV